MVKTSENDMQPNTIDLGELLREKGHRLTTPRRLVWETLARGLGHMTAEEIAERVRRRDPGVNRASVYRSLSLFASLGLARDSTLGGDGAASWELAHPDDQFHLICESCGSVEHHGGDLVEQVRTHLRADHGFTAGAVDLSVSGRCRNCA